MERLRDFLGLLVFIAILVKVTEGFKRHPRPQIPSLTIVPELSVSMKP